MYIYGKKTRFLSSKHIGRVIDVSSCEEIHVV